MLLFARKGTERVRVKEELFTVSKTGSVQTNDGPFLGSQSMILGTKQKLLI